MVPTPSPVRSFPQWLTARWMLSRLTLALMALAPHTGGAVDVFWGGSTDGSFQTLANWYADLDRVSPALALPGASDVAVLNANGTVTFPFSGLGGAVSLQGLRFNGNASSGITLGTLNDHVLTLGTAGITVDAGSGGHTINSSVTVGGNQTWSNVSGAVNPLTVAGNVSLNANLTLAGTSGITVSGPITATVNRTLTISNTSGQVKLGSVNNTATLTYNVHNGASAVVEGVMSGASYHKEGLGTLTLLGANTFTGNLRILEGKVVAKAGNTVNHQLIFGLASGAQGVNGFGIFELDNTTNDVSYRLGTLYVHTTSDGAVIQSSGGAFNATLSLNATRDFIVNETTAAVDLLVSVGIVDGDATARGLNKRSVGTMVMQGVNSYTGVTTVARGRLVLDYSVNNTNSRLADGAAVTMSGGTLELQANASSDSVETAGSLAVAAGVSTVQLTNTVSTGVTLTLAGGVTRSATGITGNGVVNFELGNTALNKVVATGGAGGAGVLLGGWATVGADRWATKNGSNEIVAFAGVEQNDRAAWTAADHVVITGALSGALRTAEVASLIFDAPVANTLTLDNAAQALTLGTSAVLVTADVGSQNTLITGGQLLTRNSAYNAATEWIFTNYSTGTLTIASHIGSSNTPQSATLALTLAGPGLIEVSGDNSYNGITNVQGNVRVSGGNAFNDYAALYFAVGGQMTGAGAMLTLAGGTEAVGNLSGGAATDDTYAELGRGELSLGTGGTLIVNQMGNTSFHGKITGSGTLIKRGSGTLTLSTNGNHTMTGELQVQGGLLDLSGGTEGFASINTVRIRGGQIRSEQNQGSSVNKLGNSAVLILEGTAGDGYRVTSNQNGTRTESVGKLELQGGSNTFTITNSLTPSATNNAMLTTMAFATNSTDSFKRANGATLLVRGVNLGGSASATTAATRVTFANYTSLDAFLLGDASNTGTKRKILPFLLADFSPTGAGTTFVTRDGANGLRGLNVGTEYVTTYASAVSGDNVSLTAGVAGAASATINALRLDASGGGFSLLGAGGGSNVLVLQSGALLLTAGASDNDVTLGGYDQIHAGAADAVADELVISVTSTHATPAGATLTISSQIADHGAAATSLTKTGNGTLFLAQTSNGYSGTTTINQGVLEFVAAGGLGTGSLRLAGGTLKWSVGNADDVSTGRQVELLGASVYLTPGGGGSILNTGNVFDVGANNVTLSGAVGNGGYGGLTKVGTGTLQLSAAPTYRGTTVVAEGAMNFQTIAAGTMEGLYLVASSGTVSSTVQSGMHVQSLVVGGVYGTAQGIIGQLTVNGGAVTIGDGGGEDFMLVGYRDTSAAGASGTTTSTRGDANFSAASSLTIDVSRIVVGSYQGATPSTNSHTAFGNLLLSNTSNTITAGSITLGYAPTAVINTNSTTTMNLGAGVTQINVDTWVIGGARSKATVSLGSGASFTLRGRQGGESGANLFIGDNDMNSTGTPNISSLDLSGAAFVDAKLNLLVLGRIGQASSSNGYGRGTLTFATGVIEATTVRMADHDYSLAGAGTASNTQGTINQRGTATFRFGEMSQGAGGAFYNWEGGTIENLADRSLTNQNVTITLNGGGTTTDVGLRTFTVESGQTATFEAAAELAGTGSFTKSGLGEMILRGINVNTGNLRVTQGRVSLDGTGTMDDVSWVNLESSGVFSVKNRTGASYTTDAVVSGTGVIDATGGVFTVGANRGVNQLEGVLRPGSSSVVSSTAGAATVGDGTGTLTVLGGLDLAGSASRVDRAVLQVGGTTRNIASTFSSFASAAAWVDSVPGAHASFLTGSSGLHDRVEVQGTLTLNAQGGITVALVDGYTGVFGDVFNLMDWTLLTNNGFVISSRYDDGTATGQMLDLPTLQTGLVWDTSLFLDYGTLVVAPEPSRVLLLAGGLMAMILRRRRTPGRCQRGGCMG